MSNNYKSTLQSNNTELSSNNLDLQSLIDQANALPNAGSSGGGTDTNDATATAADILLNKTAYAKGEKVTGTIPSQGAQTITPGTSNKTIAAGQYLSGVQTIKGDSNLVSSNIKKGVTIFGVNGTVEEGVNTSDATATSDEIFAGETAYGASGKVTGTFTIDSELATQNSLIPQIRGALSRKALAPVTTLPSIGEKEVCFRDYDGTLLYSCSVEDAMSLTELPELPVHEGLICQGWNYDLETIKSYNSPVDIGATYITDDGKTRLYIRIAAEGRMNVPLYFSQTVSNGVTIDWGDSSATQTLSISGNVNTTHTYSSIGDYVITLDVADGCTLGLGANSFSYCVMGSSSSSNNIVYRNMLQKVEIGNGINSIGDYTFRDCYSLSSITIPNSVTSIGERAFYNCYSVLSITIPNSVTSIDNDTFYQCESLSSIVIPNSVTSIDSSAFYNCSSLSSITIPNSVTSIGERAFQYCYTLSSITIPNSVTSIGRNAFYTCYTLSSIVIPNSISSIGTSVFASCFGMAIYDFTSHTSVPTLASTSAFDGIPSDCIIKVPAALYDEWIAATNWSTYAKYIVAV